MSENLNLKTITTIDPSPFKHLCVTIGELPSSFIESMSYYECLAWLVSYLENTVIPAVNQNGEACAELQEAFIELKTFVDDYFDNLDVQEEINNKLDEMAEEGTLQEIITTYIQANVAWTFDTVADMKLTENLVAGSYAQTLGFHSLNDGGGAIYKITDTGTADEMSVIAVGDLYANLICEKANVKQFGAYGDDTNADDTAIEGAYNYAIDHNKILYFPKATYKVTTSLELKHCVIECEGYINNSSTIILGANSTGLTLTDVKIEKINNIQIEGAKDCKFDINHAEDVVFSVDGNISNNTSMAYNRYNGIEVASLTLTGQNNGWINENEFNIKRCRGDLIITGDGSYIHNNNHFNNICIEGNDKHITITYGHSNYITYRGENSPIVTFNTDPTKSYDNVVQKQYVANYASTFSLDMLDKDTTMNFTTPEFVNKLNFETLLVVNPFNVKTMNTPLYRNDNGKVCGNWAKEYYNENIPADKPFIIVTECSHKSQRIYVTCYDNTNTAVEAQIYGPGISFNNSTKEYYTSSNVDYIILNYMPTSGVTRIKVMVETGGSATPFDWCVIKLATPMVNITPFFNEVDCTKKYVHQIPSAITTGDPIWAIGDIVYNDTPTAGGNIGWVCTVAGTGASSTWKEFGSIEA